MHGEIILMESSDILSQIKLTKSARQIITQDKIYNKDNSLKKSIVWYKIMFW